MEFQGDTTCLHSDDSGPGCLAPSLQSLSMSPLVLPSRVILFDLFGKILCCVFEVALDESNSGFLLTLCLGATSSSHVVLGRSQVFCMWSRCSSPWSHCSGLLALTGSLLGLKFGECAGDVCVTSNAIPTSWVLWETERQHSPNVSGFGTKDPEDGEDTETWGVVGGRQVPRCCLLMQDQTFPGRQVSGIWFQIH